MEGRGASPIAHCGWKPGSHITNFMQARWWSKLGSLRAWLHRHAAAIDQLGGQFLEIGARFRVEIEDAWAFRARWAVDERQIDLRSGGRLESSILAFLGCLGEGRCRALLVLRRSCLSLLLKVASHGDRRSLCRSQLAARWVSPLVESTSNTAIAHSKHRDGSKVRPPTVEDQDALVLLQIEAIGQSRPPWLV